MREIKFRAWLVNSERMLSDVTYPEADSPAHDVCEYMQFTGLRDKNGVDIYEGDVVTERQYGQGRHPWIGAIEYRNAFCWLTNSTDSHGIGGADYQPSMVEVIGNIYENPELLEPRS